MIAATATSTALFASLSLASEVTEFSAAASCWVTAWPSPSELPKSSVDGVSRPNCRKRVSTGSSRPSSASSAATFAGWASRPRIAVAALPGITRVAA